MRRKDTLFIQDILQSIKDIETFIKNIDFEGFCKDEKTKSAVVW